ncbi:TetR/AcrR family transcriptional regulator, partial [candidate division KSB1 bacterium]|nr:TetR/AcrR family transcriptional regulator [candidate division KSB1 bacterium]
AHLFAQKGFNGVSMREISENSGVTKPTIYYYFKSKEQIYRELIDAGRAHSRADVSRIQSLDWPLKKKLIEIIKQRFRDCEQYKDFSRLFLHLNSSIEDLDFISGIKREIKQEPLRILEEMIRDAIESGEIKREVNPAIAAETIIAIFQYFMWKKVEGDDRGDDLPIVEKTIELLFNGLAANKVS